MRARLGFLVALSLGGRSAAAQTPLVRWPEAVGFVAVTGVVFVLDGGIRSTIQGHQNGFRNAIANGGNRLGDPRYVLPGLLLATAGAYASGSSDLEGGSRRALKSVSLATVTTLVFKSLIGRRRPDVSPEDPYRFSPLSFRNNSLPSGHTTVAFALATSLAMESKSDVTDIVLYTLAAGTAFARMHVDKHWASDTIAGAAVGILAARYVRRHDGGKGAGAGMRVVSLSFSF